MKIISNTPLIERNSKVGKFLTVASIAVLGGGFYLSMTRPELALWSYIALLVGYVLSQLGIYFVNRWGRSPRPDEKLIKALKGLPGDYALYNYMLPVPHVLVGPAGIWVLEALHQRGEISYDEQRGRWNQTNVNWFLKAFSQEGLGKPARIADGHKKEMERVVAKTLGDEAPPVNVVLVFTESATVVDAQNAPIPTVSIDKLKDFIRRTAREGSVSAEHVSKLQSAIYPA